ncbi:MAG: DUF1573 domain-containing protein [Desulfopila sp.]|jgi:hypothetical protein|nr:DUF1573 domain-containing protein [Desulfopila sp.]
MNQFFVSVIITSLFLLSWAISTSQAATGPKALLPETVFDFGAVVEGTEVTHDFVIVNNGDEPLEINQVLSG